MTVWQIEQDQRKKLLDWLIKEQGVPLEGATGLCKTILAEFRTRFYRKKFAHEQAVWQAIHKLALMELRKTQRLADKNFGLTATSFEEMRSNLKEGDDRLFEKVFLQHFKDCMEYLKRKYKASHQDAYDVSMETLIEFHTRLKADKIHYGNLRFLFTQMASQLFLKWIKKEKIKDPIDGLDLLDEPDPSLEEEVKLLQKCWKDLDEECQNILKDFYYGEIPLNEIALALGKSAAAVRKQKQRCVEKLRSLFNRIHH